MSFFEKSKIKPILVGVCGRSCSGKSRVAKKLEERYKDVLRINQDKFFKVHAENWERPESLRQDRLLYSLKKIKKGELTHIPTHRWTEEFDRKIKPHKIILVEGYLLFTDKKISDLFDKKIFVDVSDLNILYRRTKRDNTSKNIDYTMDVVIPESKKYEKIQRERADLIIDGNKSKYEVLKEVNKHIKSLK